MIAVALILDFLRVATMLMGGVTLAFTVIVVGIYWRAHRSDPPVTVPMYFVPSIGLAYCMMVLSGVAEIFQHVVTGHEFEWWFTPLMLGAYCLSSYALIEMLRSKHLRQLAADVHAHGMR